MISQNDSVKQCVKHLHFLMELSNAAFSKYLVNKFYLHALCIKKSNEAIYKYIIENAHVWPQKIETEMIALLNHYDIWFTQFEDFKNKKEYSLNEPFVFYHLDEQSSYPKNAAQKIVDFFI